MKKELIITKDGSHSIFVPDLNETYHSKHGAITESMHIFIRNGLQYHSKNNLNILEVGFGTGLNTLLTLENLNNKNVHYTTLESHPITEVIYSNLNYYSFTKADKNTFLRIHTSDWEKEIKLSESFTLFKSKQSLQDFISKKKYDIIYFDAFAPEKQQNMWGEDIFERCFHLLNKNGFLVTYCAKGIVRRTLKSAGFEVENLAGPPGKREITRANKI